MMTYELSFCADFHYSLFFCTVVSVVIRNLNDTVTNSQYFCAYETYCS
jgi:hypothetical protein